MHLRTTSPSTALAAAVLAAASLIGLAAGPASAAGSAGPAASTGSTTAAAAGASTPARAGTAAPRAELDTARTTCLADLDLRLAKLDTLSAALTAATAVTDGHRSAQQASLAGARSGLAALRAKVAADADLRTLKADCQSMVQDYRVFALRAPQTGDVIVGDTQADAVARLGRTVPALSDALAKLAAAGKDVSGAQAALADLQAKLADAGPKAQGLADGVIGFTPAAYNADKGILTPAHTTALQVRTDLAGARADLKTIGAALKALAK